jgi:hypothetical protein
MSSLYKSKKTSGGVQKEMDPRLGPFKEGSLKKKPLKRFTLEKQQKKLKEKVARSVQKITENILTPEQKQRQKQMIEELSRGVNQEEPRDITTDVLTGQSVIRPSKSQLAKIAKKAEEELEKKRIPDALKKLEDILKTLPGNIADHVSTLVAVGAPERVIAEEIEKGFASAGPAIVSGEKPKKEKKLKVPAKPETAFYAGEDFPDDQDIDREIDRLQQRINANPKFTKEGNLRITELQSRKDLKQTRAIAPPSLSSAQEQEIERINNDPSLSQADKTTQIYDVMFLAPAASASAALASAASASAAEERIVEQKYRGKSNSETRLEIWRYLDSRRSKGESFSNERQAIDALKDFQDEAFQSGIFKHTLAEKTLRNILNEDAPWSVKAISRKSSVSSQSSSSPRKGPAGSGLKLIKEENPKHRAVKKIKASLSKEKQSKEKQSKAKSIKRFGL